MLLIEDNFKDEVVDSDPRGLMIQVGGDSLVGITYSATGKEPERPMTLHLLNKASKSSILLSLSFVFRF